LGKAEKGGGMMDSSTLTGKLVCLKALETEKHAVALERWVQDSEYSRLLNSEPAAVWPAKQMQEWFEKEFKNDTIIFGIHTLEDDWLIGDTTLGNFDWAAGNAWVGVGLGEREYWGKGYGTDAMRLVLRFAFRELNLNRVSLDVFEYNPRAIRSYERAGFKHEGCGRGWLNRDGRRWDLIYMGILRREWEELQGQEKG
jgi:RimJ/RimL family protein N-acetyltransferase